jgi:hypothetical protein
VDDPRDLELSTPNLGGRRGVLSDWTTQRWVQVTGKRVDLSDYPWLEGPVGDVDRIGSAFFRRLADRKKLEGVGDGPGRGLLADFSSLRGPTCDPGAVAIRVYVDAQGTLRTDHDLWIWGARFLRLHYRMRKRGAA